MEVKLVWNILEKKEPVGVILKESNRKYAFPCDGKLRKQ
jgi:hypothetical protein